MGAIVLDVASGRRDRALIPYCIGLRSDADVLAWLDLLSSNSFPLRSFVGGRP